MAANAAWRIFVEKKPILIGQETSIGGLFVGPGLYYLQAFAMLIANFNPIALGYLAVFTGFATLIGFFLVVRNISNDYQAFIAAFLYAISPRIISYDILASPISYMMPPAVIIFWFFYKVFVAKESKYFPLLFLALSFSFHIHLALAVFIPPALVLFLIHRPQIQIRHLVTGIIFFIIPLFPLLAFDLRHNFLISNNILKFSSDQSGISILKALQTTMTYLGVLSESILTSAKLYPLLLVILFSFIFLSKREKKDAFMITSILIIFIPLLLLAFYSGPIPEYYFVPLIPVAIFITSYVYHFVLQKNRFIFLLIILITAIVNISVLKINSSNPISFNFKNNIVDTIIADTQSESFNLYYQIPHGLNNGYRYLFKWKKKEPQETGKNLYILDYSADFSLSNYSQTYPNKQVSSKQIGLMNIISVK